MKLLLKRLAQLLGFLALVLILAVAALHWYQPKVPLVVLPPPKPVSGAAVFYNQAFAAMPKLSEEEEKLLSTKSDQPLDTAKATELLAKLEPSLKLLEQGAREKECEWELDLNLGPSLQILHVGKGLKLIHALRLRARWHLENGNTSATADDLLLILRFGRHLGEPGMLISNLVRVSTDMIGISFVARYLPQFDASSLQKLCEGIAALPPSHSMQEAMAMESKMFTPYLRNLLAKENARKAKQSWKYGVDNEKNDVNASPIITLMHTSPTLYLFMIHNYEQRIQEVEKLMGLPYLEARPKIAALEKYLEKKPLLDPFSLMLLPAPSIRLKEVQMETMWTILKTAFDAQILNPSSVRGELAKLRDPYDGGPMEMRDVPGGVELKLKSDPDKKPVTLMVGLAGK